MRFRLVIAFVALALAAGCLGSEDPQAEPQSQDVGEENEPGEGEEAANETEAQLTWTEDERSGSLSQANWAAPEEETFTVSEGTEEIEINLTSDGLTPYVFVYSPSCEEMPHPMVFDPNTFCTERVCMTEPGIAFSAFLPEPGEWTIKLTPCNLVPNPAPTGSYEMAISQLVPK